MNATYEQHATDAQIQAARENEEDSALLELLIVVSKMEQAFFQNMIDDPDAPTVEPGVVHFHKKSVFNAADKFVDAYRLGTSSQRLNVSPETEARTSGPVEVEAADEADLSDVTAPEPPIHNDEVTAS